MKRADLSPAVQQSLRRLPEPYANHYGVVPPPPPLQPPSVVAVARRHAEAMASLVRLETIASELREPWLVSRVLLRREAVSSSAIEGTNSTLAELLAVEEGAFEDDQERRQAAVQVRDYALSLEAFLPEAKRRGQDVVDFELIRALHRSVMRGDTEYEDTPGEFRRRVVWIGGAGNIAYSTYNPAPPDDVLPCLRDSVAYMRGDGYEAVHSSILTRMAVAHAHFEAVHPFRDGNGRVGRLLLPLMMAAEGHLPLYLSPFIEANKAAYYAALKAAQQRHEWHEMTGFVADAVSGTVDELLATRRALADLGAEWRARRRFRAGSASLRALSLLPDFPVLTIGRLASELAVSWAQASTAVEQLVDAGILRERTGHRRNRLFAATEVLALINRPFGAEPVIGEPAVGDDDDDVDGSQRRMSGGPR